MSGTSPIRATYRAQYRMKRAARAWAVSALAVCAMTVGSARAETVKIGVTVPTTGAAAILGIGARNAISLYPKQIAGYDLDIRVLDDASDTTASTRNARKFIGDKVDIILGSSTSPQSFSVIEAIAGEQTPAVVLGASASLVQPMDDKPKPLPMIRSWPRRWPITWPPAGSSAWALSATLMPTAIAG